MWTLVTSTKPEPKKSVIYIGNVDVQTTPDRLEQFITQRAQHAGAKAPKLFNCKFYPKEGATTCGVRITVAESDFELLMQKTFWPRPTYARPWDFDRYRNVQ